MANPRIHLLSLSKTSGAITMLFASTILLPDFTWFTPGSEHDGDPGQCTAILSTWIELNDVTEGGDEGDGNCLDFCFLWRPLSFICSCRSGCSVSERLLKPSSRLVMLGKVSEAIVEAGKKFVLVRPVWKLLEEGHKSEMSASSWGSRSLGLGWDMAEAMEDKWWRKTESLMTLISFLNLVNCVPIANYLFMIILSFWRDHIHPLALVQSSLRSHLGIVSWANNFYIQFTILIRCLQNRSLDSNADIYRWSKSTHGATFTNA